MAVFDSTFPLEEDALDDIREILLIGLASYGEVDRLHDYRELAENDLLKATHPTGSADTVSQFAEALRAFDDIVRWYRKASRQQEVATNG